MMQKKQKMTETPLVNGYSSESTHRELSNEDQHDKVQMVIKNRCSRMLWMRVASAWKGLSLVLHQFSRLQVN